MKSYNKKVVVSGEYYEVYEYSNTQLSDYKQNPNRKIKKSSCSSSRRSSSLSRSQNNIRRIINCNFTNAKNTKFITLTYSRDVSISDSSLFFKKFMRKLKKFINYQQINYIVIPELTKKKRIHYHALMTIPYISNSDLRKLWGQGFVNIRSAYEVNQVRNIGAYLCKYLTKETFDSVFFGKQAYHCSRFLKRPTEIRDDNIVNSILQDFENLEPTFEKKFDSEHTGSVIYKQYKI